MHSQQAEDGTKAEATSLILPGFLLSFHACGMPSGSLPTGQSREVSEVETLPNATFFSTMTSRVKEWIRGHHQFFGTGTRPTFLPSIL